MLTVPSSGLLTVTGCAAIMAPAVYWAYTRSEPDDGQGRRFAQPTGTNMVTSACLAPFAAVGSVGVITVLGAVALPVIVAIALTSPAILGRHWPHRSDTGRTTAPEVSLPQPAPGRPAFVPGEITTDELCREWRVSFVLLQACTDALMRTEVVTHRTAVLDEIAARDPAGFDRWINSGARAASDPQPFLTHRGTRS